MWAASEDLGGVTGIAAAVPGEERARSVTCRGVEFPAQDFAADDEPLVWIAERGKKHGIEAGFAGDLPHHLHQAPGKGAGIGFRSRDLVVRVEARDIFAEKRRLIAHGPGIPAGLLLDDGADQRGIEGLRGRGFAGQRQELGWRTHGEIS